MKNIKKAFSLVKLSIVLIITGLLISGVAAGSKLIENGKIHKLINEISELQQAYNSFKLIYEFPPGDLNNAQDFWGTTDILNGDGDRRVEWLTESCNSSLQLQKAELINYNIYPRASPCFDLILKFTCKIYTYHT